VRKKNKRKKEMQWILNSIKKNKCKLDMILMKLKKSTK
jgi:hypothetical protein